MISSHLNSSSHAHIPSGGQVQCRWRLLIGRPGSAPRSSWLVESLREASHVVATECRGSLILTESLWAARIDICFVRWKDAVCVKECVRLGSYSPAAVEEDEGRGFRISANNELNYFNVVKILFFVYILLHLSACPSVRPSISQSINLSVHPSVSRSVSHRHANGAFQLVSWLQCEI